MRTGRKQHAVLVGNELHVNYITLYDTGDLSVVLNGVEVAVGKPLTPTAIELNMLLMSLCQRGMISWDGLEEWINCPLEGTVILTVDRHDKCTIQNQEDTMAKKEIQLKTLNGKSETEKYEVTGFEALIPEIRKVDKEIEALDGKREAMRDAMMNRIRDIKLTEEEKGILYKTFIVNSADGIPATVLFKNSFSKLDVENEAVMRKMLGDLFDTLYTKESSMQLRKGVDLDALRKALGPLAETYFEKKEYIAFAKDFMEQRLPIRKTADKKVNAQIDKWASDCQAKPDLRLKG
jgi:hypothetical protein